MSTMIQALTNAREILADPERWARNITYIEDKGGNYVSPENAKLHECKFCLVGAVAFCLGQGTGTTQTQLDKLADAAGLPRPVGFNDNHTHAGVLEYLDQLIEYETNRILRDAADLIEGHKWIQGDMAQDNQGASVDIMHKNATCFCTLGAIHRAAGTSDTSVSLRPVNKLAKSLNPACGVRSDVWRWNDYPDRTREEVISKLREVANA